MAAIMRDDPPELTQSGRNISPALGDLVKHCLEKDRDNRFQTAKDVAFNLAQQSPSMVASGVTDTHSRFHRHSEGRSFIAFAVLVVLAAAVLFLLWRSDSGRGRGWNYQACCGAAVREPGGSRGRVFRRRHRRCRAGDLTSVPGLEVIARGSSMPYKKRTTTPQEISRELDAHYLLTATVRWQKGPQGTRVR